MPATTENTDILNAINQTVQALIDLGVSFGGGSNCPDVTVNNTVPVPVVNVYPTFNVNCGGGGGGSYPPQTGGTEGGTPPPGTSEPSDIDNRKCIVANILVQDLIAYTNNMSMLGLFNWSLDWTTLGTILNSLSTGFGNGLMAIGMQAGGYLSNLQTVVFSGFSETSAVDIPSALSANQADIVCALYNAANVAEAQAAAISASGLTGFDASYLETVLNNSVLNMLFFTVAGSEAVINFYAGAADCSGCTTEELCDHLIGNYSATSVYYFGSPDRYGIEFNTTNGGQIPELAETSCYFGFKDNHITVTNFTTYGSYYNIEYTRYGGITESLFTNDINNYVFDGVYSHFQVYQSTTQFTIEFEIDRSYP